MKLTLAFLLLVLLTAGCGSDRATPTAPPPPSGRPNTRDFNAVMEAAVRQALKDNLTLSRRVLWTNDVPSSAISSTRGAALAELRRSAADRRRARVRVRVVKPQVRVESVRVGPSYEQASATVINQDRERIQPRNGNPRTVTLNEHAHIELRRLGGQNLPRFVVWQVSGAR